MPTASFTVAFPRADIDVGADAIAAVFNTSSNTMTYVAICEVRANPMPINDDTANAVMLSCVVTALAPKVDLEQTTMRP